jgi:hypothetical protein
MNLTDYLPSMLKPSKNKSLYWPSHAGPENPCIDFANARISFATHILLILNFLRPHSYRLLLNEMQM